MYTPSKLRLVNLLSHKHTEYEFFNGEAVMVVGENKDDDGQESNGSGKSALIEGISLALTGNPFRKVKDADMIYYGEESSEIVLELQNRIIGEELTIIRTLFANKNKSSTLECWIDGEKETKAFPTVRDGNRWILEKIGVSREDLINYFIVSKSKSVSFFGQSDTDKKAIVARFSGTDPLLPIKEEVKLDIGKLDGDKLDVENELLRLHGKSDAYQEQIDLANTDDQVKLKATRIKSREETISLKEGHNALLSDTLKGLQVKQQSLNKSLALLNTKLSSFKVVDYTTELSKLKTKQISNSKKILEATSKIDAIVTDITSYKTFKTDIEQNIADEIECPSCQHLFILRDKEYDLEGAKEQLPTVIEMITQLESDKKAEQDSMTSIRGIQDNISTQMEECRKKSRKQEDDKSVIEKSIRTKQAEIDKVKLDTTSNTNSTTANHTSISELKQEIINIESEELIDTTLEIGKKIDENKEAIKTKDKELDEIKTKYVKLKEFEGVFVKFITHLSNKAVKSIELRTNQYLGSMGSNLSIEIEGYKVNSDGSIREKFTTVVSRDGIPEAFIESFSEGEQSRINIATTLALNSLLNMSCDHGKGLGLVVLDELMGSLDRLGVGLTMEALNSLGQTILAISHVEPRSPYKNTLLVTKENGNSTIRNI